VCHLTLEDMGRLPFGWWWWWWWWWRWRKGLFFGPLGRRSYFGSMYGEMLQAMDEEAWVV
jgi:hypothetical protein